jgi:glycerophosphoryl diester phosphodiesterase
MDELPGAGNTHLLAPVVGGKRRVFCCHRATLSGVHVPNSLPAVAECIAALVPRIEIDVRFLADDGMLVFHDAELDDDTTATGLVGALDTAAARRLRFRRDESVPVSFLEDVVEALKGSATLLQVDLKLMPTMSRDRVKRLSAALAPIREQVLIGSQAHWNLRPLHDAGYRVALDPTLHWHYNRRREATGLDPARLGLHGLWDDSPVAHLQGTPGHEYVHARIGDLLGLLPATEWMVDFATIEKLATLGAGLGHILAGAGVELAAWTVKDNGRASTGELLGRLFDLGVTTVITDSPATLAGYV